MIVYTNGCMPAARGIFCGARAALSVIEEGQVGDAARMLGSSCIHCGHSRQQRLNVLHACIARESFSSGKAAL